MVRIARALFWLAVIGLAIVTLGPPDWRPRTHETVDLERFLAFAAAGILLGLAYPSRKLLSGIGLVIFAAALEYGQNYVAGRHGLPHDFEVKATGAVAGVACAAILAALLSGRIARLRARRG
jgi:VanZ family protein